MSYPKPLSEKSLEKLYTQAGLSPAVREFLHNLFAACANLYGTIDLRGVWSAYQEIRGDAPRVRRSDLIAFSSIVRRETQPYLVYEIQELYREEPPGDLDRHIVSRELLNIGYGKLYDFYTLVNGRINCPYCIPKDFLSYASPTVTAEDKALLDFLGNLKSTTRECTPMYGRPYPNENRGKRLKEFSFLSQDEQFQLEYYKKPSVRAALMERWQGTGAEKLFRQYKRAENVGFSKPAESAAAVVAHLEEMGVQLPMAQANKLLSLLMDWHNHSRLWCTRGWKPTELAATRRSGGTPAISFGPGLEKAFAKGDIDREVLEKQIQELGWKVLK